MGYDEPHHRRRGDLYPESSGWLFESPFAGRGHIVAVRLQAAQLVKCTVVSPRDSSTAQETATSCHDDDDYGGSIKTDRHVMKQKYIAGLTDKSEITCSCNCTTVSE